MRPPLRLNGITNCNWDTVIPIEPMWVELKRIVKSRAAIVLTATQPFTSRLVSSNYEMFRYEWIWEKNVGIGFLNSKHEPMRWHENILVFANKRSLYYPQKRRGKGFRVDVKGVKTKIYGKQKNVFSINNGDNYFPKSIIHFGNENGKGKLHPTQKPLKLFEYLIKTYTLEGQIVLDMTCGSGTTALAAQNLGRQFICGDITLEYVEIARKRLQDADPYQATIHADGSKQLSLFEGLEAE